MSEDTKIVIIGCGAAGATAAQFARKTNRKAEITIIEKSKYSQYSKCGLPYAISEEIPEFSDLIEYLPEWFEKSKINLLLETTVEKIDKNKKLIIAKKGAEELKVVYDKLIIATGATPTIPPIKSIKDPEKLRKGIFVLRTLDDAKNISEYIKNSKNAVIVGAGLIGLELADNFYKKGLNVTVVEALPQILPNTLDKDMSEILLKKIEEKVKIFTNHLALEVKYSEDSLSKVIIKNKESGEEKEISADILVISTGCKPNTKLAEDLGCEIGKCKSIVVDSTCKTSVDSVFAVGDCTEYIDYVTGKFVPIGLGSIAVRQGIAAGITAAGGKYILPSGVLQTCTSDLFGLEIAAVGTNFNNLDLKVVSGKFNGRSLPEYFPGGKDITIKVSTDEKGKIINAQAVGSNAAQRINVFACGILNKMDVNSFRKLETAYAPPVAPTLDPITLVCDIICKKLEKKR